MLLILILLFAKWKHGKLCYFYNYKHMFCSCFLSLLRMASKRMSGFPVSITSSNRTPVWRGSLSDLHPQLLPSYPNQSFRLVHCASGSPLRWPWKEWESMKRGLQVLTTWKPSVFTFTGTPIINCLSRSVCLWQTRFHCLSLSIRWQCNMLFVFASQTVAAMWFVWQAISGGGRSAEDHSK